MGEEVGRFEIKLNIPIGKNEYDGPYVGNLTCGTPVLHNKIGD